MQPSRFYLYRNINKKQEIKATFWLFFKLSSFSVQQRSELNMFECFELSWWYCTENSCVAVSANENLLYYRRTIQVFYLHVSSLRWKCKIKAINTRKEDFHICSYCSTSHTFSSFKFNTVLKNPHVQPDQSLTGKWFLTREQKRWMTTDVKIWQHILY